jgi:hypothetical protein
MTLVLFSVISGAKRHFNCLPGHRVLKILSCVDRNALSRAAFNTPQTPLAVSTLTSAMTAASGRDSADGA